jgi:hypothetical protein
MHAAIPPLIQYVFMVWCLVKHRDFTLTVRKGPVKQPFEHSVFAELGMGRGEVKSCGCKVERLMNVSAVLSLHKLEKF